MKTDLYALEQTLSAKRLSGPAVITTEVFEDTLLTRCHLIVLEGCALTEHDEALEALEDQVAGTAVQDSLEFCISSIWEGDDFSRQDKQEVTPLIVAVNDTQLLADHHLHQLLMFNKMAGRWNLPFQLVLSCTEPSDLALHAFRIVPSSGVVVNG